MIRFSATLVVVAIGVLFGGVATSKLTLIYIAIAISAVALVTLAIGVALKREELFGEGQVLAPADAGASTELSAPGQPATVGGRADRTAHNAVLSSSAQDSARPGDPVAPAVQQAPWPESVAAAAPVAEGRAGQPAYGRPAFGQNPARNPWPTSNEPSGWSAAQPAASSDGTQGRPPWIASAGEQSGWDRQAGPVSDWQAGPPGKSPAAPRDAAAPDTSAPGTSAPDSFTRDNAGRPPLPGRHSRNAGSDVPWSPFPPAESGPKAESSSPPPFSPTPRRVPGASLGSNWLDRQDDPDRPAPPADDPGQEEPAAEETAALDSTALDSTALEGTAPGSTAPGSTAPGSGWSGSSTAASSDEDDWPSRYSWPDDDETGKPEAPGHTSPAATTVSPQTPQTPATATALPSPSPDEVAPASADADEETVEPAKTIASEPAALAEPTALAEPAVAAEPGEPGITDEAGQADASGRTDAPAEGDDLTESDDLTQGDHVAEPAADGIRLVTVVPGVPRYHEPNCILIRFMPEKDVQSLTVPEAKKLGTPCVACQPED